MATTVAKTPGSIAYTNLAEARVNGSFTPGAGKGGPGTAKFWAPIQDNGLVTTKQKYADPSFNKDAEALSEANCKLTEYTNGTVAFPPESAQDAWNEVTTSTTEKSTRCAVIVVELAFTSYLGVFGGKPARGDDGARLPPLRGRLERLGRTETARQTRLSGPTERPRVDRGPERRRKNRLLRTGQPPVENRRLPPGTSPVPTAAWSNWIGPLERAVRSAYGPLAPSRAPRRSRATGIRPRRPPEPQDYTLITRSIHSVNVVNGARQEIALRGRPLSTSATDLPIRR